MFSVSVFRVDWFEKAESLKDLLQKTPNKKFSSFRVQCSVFNVVPVSYTHLTLPTNREV